MKKLFLFLFAAALFTTACNDDDGSPSPIINPSAKLSCNIDGSSWSAVTRVTTNTQGTFVISGSTLSSDALNITIIGESTGTYTLGTAQYGFSATYSPVASNTDSVYQALNGTVVLSEVNTTDKKISGTFNFNARNVTNLSNEITVTDGVFTALYYN